MNIDIGINFVYNSREELLLIFGVDERTTN